MQLQFLNKNSVPAPKKIQRVIITKIGWLMLFKFKESDVT
jgi:hypothetical protein